MAENLEFVSRSAPTPYRPQADKPAAEKTSDDEQAEKDEAERKRQLHDRVIKRTNLSASAFAKQREQELEDLQFDRGLPEDQWLPDFLAARKGGIGKDGRYTPPRPTLTIPKQDQPVQQILAEARSARFSIRVKPGPGEHASIDGARIRQELYRAIEVDSRAWMARNWALDRAVKCGRGAYRVRTAFVNDVIGDTPRVEDFDRKIVIDRILNQHGVYDDPFAKEADFSDREFLSLTSDIPEDEYKRRWPKRLLSLMSAEQVQGVGDTAGPGWVQTDDQGKKSFRIVEHYYYEHREEPEVLLQYEDGTIAAKWKAELAKGEEEFIIDERPADRRKVKWCVADGAEITDEEDLDGKYIPVVVTIGKEYNVSGQRSFQGVITKSKDAQRSYNVMRSEQVTLVGLATKAPWIMAEGQDEDYEEMWDDANTRYFTRIYYKPKTHDGQLVPPPQRASMSADIASVTQLAREAEADVRATTGREQPSLGILTGREKSGRALREAKVQGETTTSIYIDNLAMMSMTYESKVVLDLMPYVYDRPGRIERALGDDPGDERLVMLNRAFVKPKPGDMPLPVPPGQPFDPDQHALYEIKHGGEFGAVVEVGKQLQNQREEDSEFLQALAQAAPNLVPLFADLWVGSLDSPFAKRIAERIKRANPALANENEDGTPSGQIPPAVQAQMAQMQEQLQGAMAKVQELSQVIAEKQIEAQSRETVAKINAAKDIRIADAQVRAQLIIEQAKLDQTQSKAIIDAELKHTEQRLEQAHELRMAAHDAATAAATQGREHAQELRKAGVDAATDAATQARDHVHDVATAAISAAPAVASPDAGSADAPDAGAAE